jgi:pyruvate,orthophosphate dikinase
VSGRLCTEVDEAIAAEARGDHVILVRRETSPADIAGMAAARGLVTTRGGLVSHAAVIARSWGLPAVVGVSGLTVESHGITVGERSFPAGEILTVDGDRGVVLLGDHPSEEIEVDEVHILRRWQRHQSVGADDATVVRPGFTEAATVQTCERVLALKGAATAAGVAEALGCAVDDVTPIVADLVSTDAAQELPGDRVRLLPVALERVAELFAADSARLASVIEPLLGEFHAVNDGLKQVMNAWQTREIGGETVPNDHADAAHDASVIDRLQVEVHPAILSIIEVVATSEPRFRRYSDRLAGALAAIGAGDAQMVAHPLRGSYHTVWFELHEELIRLTGRTRADEAAAGRA